MRKLAVATTVLAAAVLVGAAAQLGDAAPGVSGWTTALGAPWLLAAFAAGALLARPVTGALGGAALLSGGTASYYAVQLALTGHVRALSVGTIALGWAAAAAVAGAVMGTLGALWRGAARRAHSRATRQVQTAGRPGPRTVASGALLAAIPAAALAGEALLLAGEWRSRAALAVVAAELALAAILLPACAWRRAPLAGAAVAAAVLAVAFAAGEAEVRDAMRAVGWRGA